MKREFRRTVLFIVAALFISCMTVAAADNPPVDEGWPRELTSKGMTGMVFEPQVDSWDGFNLKAHSAVAVKPSAKEEPVYGVITFTAHTLVDKSERIVNLEGLQITDVKFPSAAERAPDFLPVLQLTAKKKVRNIALDSLEAAMAASDQFKVGGSVPVKNDVPQIIVANKASVLVYIDGDPRYVPVKDADGTLLRVLNTRALLLKDAKGKHYLHLFDGYMEAPSLEGPWTVSTKQPKDVKKAEKAARDSGQVDLMEGEPDTRTKEAPSLRSLSPQIYIALRPTELIVTEGDPNFVPLAGTELLYVTNTTGNIFKYLKDNRTYVLLAGRWFRAPSLGGPWEYVPHKSLPADFARIPDDSPKENVKASVPDTPQAREALIADSIPQTTKVKRDDARFVNLEFDGEPVLEPIQDTPLSYVINCSTPVIKVDDQTWYAVESGVWFTATSLDGPWVVADSVPASIYSIPASSPLHYVTYVKVYGSTPEDVYVGYTPGYFGTVESEDVVVYGTGYYYRPWIGTYWYGPPITYGLGCSIGWTPWWGWGFGFGFGWGWGPFGVGWFFPPAPWWGPFWGWGHFGWGGHTAWGPRGWAHTSGNIYRRGGPSIGGSRFTGGRNPATGTRLSGRYGSAYNSRTGSLVAGQRGSVRNVYATRYAADARGNVTRVRTGQPSAAGIGKGRQGSMGRGGNQVFATREGRVYRPSSKGSWESVNPSGRSPQAGTQPRSQDFSRTQRARQTGQQRYQSFQANRPSGGFQPSRPASGFSRGSGYSPSGGGFSRGGGSGRGGGGLGRGGGGSGHGSGSRGGVRH